MVSKTFSFVVVLTALSCANGQYKPFEMNGFFQNMGGSMQNMFQNMQNSFKMLVPWYHGENVCVDENFHPDPMAEQMYAEEFGQNSHTETCRGNNFKYICMGNVVENGQPLQRVRKYECCPGFVRAMEGPGCIPNNNNG